MTEEEFKEWQKGNSTLNKIRSDFEKKWGVKLRDGIPSLKSDPLSFHPTEDVIKNRWGITDRGCLPGERSYYAYV
jgi:hypothetical protein